MIEIVVGLIVIFLLWKLLVDGWLFKIPILIAGWFGLIFFFRAIGIRGVAFRLGEHGDGTPIGWAFLLSSFFCLAALATTRIKND